MASRTTSGRVRAEAGTGVSKAPAARVVDRGTFLGLAVVLLGGAALRAWSLTSGLPFPSGDERNHFVGAALEFFGGDYDPHYFINPPALSYLLHGVFAVGWLGDGAVAARGTDPTLVFGLARAVVAVVGVLAIVAVYLAGRRLGGPLAGLGAAAVIAFSDVAVTYSRLALNDVPAMAASALALWAAARCLTAEALPVRTVALAGACVGLAVTTKYTAGISVVPLAVVLAWRFTARRSPSELVRDALVTAIAAAVVFFALDPFALSQPGFFLGQLRAQSATSDVPKLGQAGGDGFTYYLRTLTWSLGWVALVAAVAGAVSTLRSRRVVALMLLAPVVLFVLYMGSHERYFARWLLPVYPHLCVLAGLGLARLAGLRRLRTHGSWLPVVAAALVLLVVQTAVGGVVRAQTRARTSTTTTAHDWLVAHVPRGSRVVLDPTLPEDFGLLRPGGVDERWSTWSTVHPLRPRLGLADDYARGLEPGLLDRYRAEGFCWVVTSESEYGRVFLDVRLAPGAVRYYEALNAAGGVAARFSPYDTSDVAPGRSPVSFAFDRYVFLRDGAFQRPGYAIVVQRLTGGRCR